MEVVTLQTDTLGEPGSDTATYVTWLTTTARTIVDALRAGDPKMLNCDILEGHLSSTLPHLAHISYRVWRALRFDGKAEKIVGDDDANRLLTRDYRKPYAVPKKV